MKNGGLAANIEVGLAMSIIALLPHARPDDMAFLYWFSQVLHFAAYFIFVDGLRRFRNDISREIDEKTQRT